MPISVPLSASADAHACLDRLHDLNPALSVEVARILGKIVSAQEVIASGPVAILAITERLRQLLS